MRASRYFDRLWEHLRCMMSSSSAAASTCDGHAVAWLPGAADRATSDRHASDVGLRHAARHGAGGGRRVRDSGGTRRAGAAYWRAGDPLPAARPLRHLRLPGVLPGHAGADRCRGVAPRDRLCRGGVATTRGTTRARFIVDATGWRALHAPRGHHAGYDVETELPLRLDIGPGLHFYFEKRIGRNGYAWVFPCGGTTRFGVGAFEQGARLAALLPQFLERFGLQPGSTHGGVLAIGRRARWPASACR